MKIFLTGADKQGWALDTDFRLASEALGKFAQVVGNIMECDYIHSIWPNQLFLENRNIHRYRKPIVAVFQGDPVRLFETTPGFYKFCNNVFCVAQTTHAEDKLKSMGLNCSKIPYIADLKNFSSLGPEKIRTLKQAYGIPNDMYIIANFMRDSLGNTLNLPKPEKGPDIFIDIVESVIQRIGNNKIHVLLAGPRRHWIKTRLREKGIGFTYVGREIPGDDYPANILELKTINELINISNLMLVTSRSEGGPRAILEAATCKVPIISTSVGLTRDILNSKCVYDTVPQAVNLIIEDYNNKCLTELIDEHELIVRSKHSVDVISQLWKNFYENIDKKQSSVDIKAFSNTYRLKEMFGFIRHIFKKN